MTSFHSLPIYESERSAKNMWQDYRVYPEGIELRVRIVFVNHTFIIPAADIIEVKVAPSFFRSLFRRGGPSFREALITLKLDWADMCEHVSLHRKSGLFKYMIFTPDDPARFVAACQSIVKSSP